MEPSEELRQVVSRFIEALRVGDEDAVSNRITRQPGFERFGTDPDEDWHDGETAARVWVQQIREMGGGYPWHVSDPGYAFVEGTVGWAGGKTKFETPFDEVVVYRYTCVCHLEHGDWKLVQWHGSIPTTNEEHGFFLTKSVDQIAEEVNEARPDLSAASAPDGTVTIAFTDIEGSTKLNGLLGDERWLTVLRAHNEVVTDVTKEHGGTVVKGQGDGFMLAFASARRSLSCAQAIQLGISERFNDPGSPIRVRIGVHVGEMLREDDDFFGHAVNYAARVASSASGGEILVSALVHALVEPAGGFRFEEPRTVELKGVDGPQIVYPLAAVGG
jgi:class 3 adenylate cyclase